jgi:hypothetical protein
MSPVISQGGIIRWGVDIKGKRLKADWDPAYLLGFLSPLLV